MAIYDEGTIKRGGLLAGTEVTAMTTMVTVAAGQKLEAGAVLGKITDSGEYALVDSTATDGSEEADLILYESLDTEGKAKNAVCYKSGVFCREVLHFGGSDTAEQHEATLRLKNIHLKKTY